MASITHTAVLTCHPSNLANAVQRIGTQLRWTKIGALAVTYRLTGDIPQLRIEALQSQRRADQLWQHTCFEAFIGVSGTPHYYEFNFSPSQEWAAYSFRGYRDGRPIEDEELALEISVSRSKDNLELDAIVRLSELRLVQPGTIFRLGLSAVIEANDGTLSYWALNHPSDKPDFHHPDSFALELALPIESA